MGILKMIVSRPLLAALLVGFLVTGAVLLFVGNRPAEYSARIGLLASPQQDGWAPGASSTDFPAVAAQSMAAIVEVARSPSVLESAGAAVPGAPTPDRLFDDVKVDLVPGSSLARVTVRADTADTAEGLARKIATQVVGKQLLAPVGTIRVIDDQPLVTRSEPDRAMSAGLALFAGVTAAAVVYGLLALLLPSTHRRIARALGDAGINRPVPVMAGTRFRDVFARIETLASAAARPVRVIGLTPGSARDAEKLQLELATAGLRVSETDDDRDAAVVGVASGRRVSRSIRWTISALPDSSPLIAIVVQ